ncbi:MAG: helix-turn-helix domain-containing protein [Herpetosiphonaceae bacterium]|nr:helix-turn-helix domain-containing protein [Herpetosiphonaceae bacterium]
MTSILLIDEDRTLLAALTTLLESANYTVARALTDSAARQALRETPPDLVVLEVDFGRGAGWALLDEAVAAGTRVLVLSRHFRTEDVVRGLEAGATEYLAKPYRAEEVLSRIAVRLQQPAPLPVQVPTIAQTTAASSAPAPQEPGATPSELEVDATLPLGQRLRAARKARNISLVQANLETKIQMYYIQALEEEKYSLLPRGASTDALIQRYATFLGDDPNAALAEFRRLHHNEIEGPRDLAGQPVVRRRRWPLAIALLAIALLTCGLTAGALTYIFPTQTSNVVTNVRGLFAEPTPTPPPTPTLPPTAVPTATATETPPPTRTPTTTPTLTLTVVPPTATSPITGTVTP